MAYEPASETYTLPPSATPANEGDTPAAWAMFWGVCVGMAVAGVGFTIGNWVMLAVGVVVVVGGLLVSLGMRRAGKGQPLQPSAPRDWYSD